MSVMNELNRSALREHREYEDRTLERVNAEALNLELLPEGEEARHARVIVDGHEVAPPRRRIRGKLTVKW